MKYKEYDLLSLTNDVKDLFKPSLKLNLHQIQTKLYKKYIYPNQYILKKIIELLLLEKVIVCIENKTKYRIRKWYKLYE